MTPDWAGTPTNAAAVSRYLNQCRVGNHERPRHVKNSVVVGTLPSAPPRHIEQIVSVLNQGGFVVRHTKGSHYVYVYGRRR